MKKRVLFFSCEPGGAEVLLPAVELLLKEPDFLVTVLAYGHGFKRFCAGGVPVEEVSPDSIASPDLLRSRSPSLVITSAASLYHKDVSERMLWRNAGTMGIKTMAFLDQWQNYSLRFSSPRPEGHLDSLPDLINCLNDIGMEEMVREGFPKERLVPLGHPFLSSVPALSTGFMRSEILAKLGVPEGKTVLLFVSEPLEEHYGLLRGYTQYSALDFFLRHMLPAKKDAVLVHKAHPKDEPGRYRGILSHLGGSARIVRDEVTPLEAIAGADEVYGMTSVMLIKAFLMGKLVVTVQPGLLGEDQMVLSRHGYIRRVVSPDDVATRLSPWNTRPFDVEFKEAAFMNLVRKLAG